MKPLLRAIALTLALLSHTGASAQWQWSVGTGLRQVRLVEREPAGRQLVREHGRLPGLQAAAVYQAGAWRLGLAGELHQGELAYQGQSQAGSGFASHTDTKLGRIGLLAKRALSERTGLIGALEWDRWRRAIQGRDTTLGLHERYSSWRLVAGVQTRLLSHPAASLDGSALLVLAQPERLRVQFGCQVYDDASLETRSARGLRLVLRLQPASTPDLAITAEWDSLAVARSAQAPLFQHGLAAGSVVQPRHSRQTLSLGLLYSF